jgi:hypothetical protein
MRDFELRWQPRDLRLRRRIMRSAWQLFVLVVGPAVLLVATFFGDAGSTTHPPTTWYCADDGGGAPRSFEQARVGLHHQCTDDDMHDAGYWSGVV